MAGLDFARASELVRFLVLEVGLASLAVVGLLAAIVPDAVQSGASWWDFEAADFDTAGVAVAREDVVLAENLAFLRDESRRKAFEQIAPSSNLTVCRANVVCYEMRVMVVVAGLEGCH